MDHTTNVSMHNINTELDPAFARMQYGQVTPPNDKDEDGDVDEETLGNKRMHSSVDGDRQAPKRNRNSRKSQPDEDSAVEDDKRNKFLERNRVAASKCRQKKKEWTNGLEARARDLQAEKNDLMLMTKSLNDEVLYLKGELLKHANCGCAHIGNYLAREVQALGSGQRSPRSAILKSEPLSPGQNIAEMMLVSSSAASRSENPNKMTTMSKSHEEAEKRKLSVISKRLEGAARERGAQS